MTDIINANKKWFKGVDSIRFILALIVVLSHFDDPFINILTHSANKLIQLSGLFLANAFDGTAAVIAFFVISGFVIHYPNKNGIKDLKTFWIRRFLRIFIPLIVVFLIGIKFNHPDKAVIWSLICELIYYALYPLLSVIKIKWLYKFIAAYIVALVVIVIGAHNDVSSFFKQTDVHYHSYYWQLGIYITWLVGLPVWLLGVLIAEHIDKLETISFSKVLLYRISIFTLSCFLIIGRSYLYLSYILSMNVFALLIYKWLQAEIVYFKTRQPNALLEKMGKFSYSLYLCHPIIYLLLSIWITKNAVTYPLFIALTIVISYLFYIAVEKPSHLLAVRLTKNISKDK